MSGEQRKKQKERKKFIKLPEYPGGKKALMQFISEHLQYPADALEKKIEGVVAVAYEVNDDGQVISTSIVKSLFPSCDKEAVRLVSMLQYGKVVNRGLRVKSKCKLNINFCLKKMQENTVQISYTVTQSPSKKSEEKLQKPNQSHGYGYSINISE